MGLFAGIAGLELGLSAAGHTTLLFCEIDPGAQAVLRHHFPRTDVVRDVRELFSLPRETELITAGFPCQDLSQAGNTQGINGAKSGVVSNLFRLLRDNDVPHVLIENVPFMLQLNRGQAIKQLIANLESLDYRWAYRVVDARAFGLPQRRERVILLASKMWDPKNVLFAEEAEPVEPEFCPHLACGFYWTEGTRGLGWAVDAVPTMKGGSTIGIASPPAVWLPDGRVVLPSIRDGERLQGFADDWTLPSNEVARPGHRWKLVGNAVSVRTATWVGQCLARLPDASKIDVTTFDMPVGRSWPSAAYGAPGGSRAAVRISKWPRSESQVHLADFLDVGASDLSLKAVTGFINRLTSGSLRYPDEFLWALRAHQERMVAKANAG